MCNNELRGYRGVIESLNFPNVYPRNQDCTWTIIAPLGNKINITFSHFDVEENVLFGDKICKFDYIQVYYYILVNIYVCNMYYILQIEEKASEEEDETEEILLDKYCGGTLPPLISSTKNLVKVHFITDSLVQSSGFRLEWVVDGKTCIHFISLLFVNNIFYLHRLWWYAYSSHWTFVNSRISEWISS